MTQLTILEASRVSGKSVKTIYRHIANGKISCILNRDNVKVIDLSELTRVYELKPSSNEKVITPTMPSHENNDSLSLRQQLALSQESAHNLKLLLDEKDKRIELLTYSLQTKTTQVASRLWIYLIMAVIITALAVNLAWFIPNLQVKI